MNTKNKVVIAFTAIVLGMIVSPAIAAIETDAMKTSVESFENSSKSNTVKTVMIIGHETPKFIPHINQDGQEGGLVHDVVSVDGKTGVPDNNFKGFLPNVGDIYTVKFSEPGTYHYIDTIYPNMRGTIVVS